MADPFSTGASVLAVVLASLKAAKVAHEILSSFKDGPENVKRATADLEGLLSTLEELSTCPALTEHGGEVLREPIDACLGDVESLVAKIKSLTLEAGDPRRVKYRKRFMAAWDEKALSKVSSKVASHTAILNLRLNALQSGIVVGIPGRLDSISQTLTTQAADLSTSREQITTLTRVINEGITGFSAGLEAIKETTQTTSSASDIRHLETRSLLEQILHHVAGTATGKQNADNGLGVQDGSAATTPLGEEIPPTKRSPCEELKTTITRLCNVVYDRQLRGRVTPGEANDIISDLLLALELMRTDEFLQAGVTSNLVDQGVCSTCCRRHLADLRTSLAAVYSALLSARQVAVNDVDRVQPRSSRRYRLYQQNDMTLSAYETSIGTLSVVVRRQQSQPNQPDSRSPSQIEEEEVTTSVSLVSRSSPGQRRVKAEVKVRQTYSCNGVFSAIPHFLVSNVLPAGSPVFSIVQQGRLREFQDLLREGKASLRDQDEYGASLLFYANRQPEMCRYLIQSGADVDHVASHRGVNNLRDDEVGSALCIGTNDNEADDLHEILACRIYLLEAGCDPTTPILYSDDPNVSKFADILEFAVPEAVRVVLDFGSSFVNTKTTILGGLTPLHAVCKTGRWSVEVLDVLLQRNADITERDSNGRTCLHHCLNPMSDWWNAISNFGPNLIPSRSMGIIYLIDQGADIFAKDFLGVSVSGMAYAPGIDKRTRKILGGARGDVWDFSLAVCGYNITDFREKIRRPRYGTYYTRKDFEKLWAGHEHLCPYYDDEDVSSDEEMESFLDEEGSDEEGSDGEESDGEESDGEESDEEESDEEEWVCGRAHKRRRVM